MLQKLVYLGVAAALVMVLGLIAAALLLGGGKPAQRPPGVEVVGSKGSCAAGQLPSVTMLGREGYVAITVRAQAPNPCYRIVPRSLQVDEDARRVAVALGLEASGEICVQCVGVVEGVVKIGPLPPGEWVVEVSIGGRKYSAKVVVGSMG